DIDSLDGDLKQISQFLFDSGTDTNREKLYQNFGLSAESNILEKLVKKGLVVRSDNAVRREKDANLKMARLTELGEEYFELKLSAKQKSVMEILCDVGNASVKEICYFSGVTSSVLTTLSKKGLLEIYDQVYYRRPYEFKSVINKSEILLTSDQQKAYDELSQKYSEDKPCAALLYGVTGSGKTQVFLKLCEDAVTDGKGVIVMVPEIALTPQTLAIFHNRFGDKVAVFHSAMSQGQRMDEWQRVKCGDAKIAVGTRSAAFAPFDNLGLIIMDEEQEHTYKSERSPRFHARDVARFRASKNNALLVLASATPSIESYTAAKSGRYILCELKERYGNAVLPEVITVDMRLEIASGNSGAISKLLYDYLDVTIKTGHQAILLLNRRGYNTFVSCPSCGHIMTCENCSISMTFHSANNRLMCHYCGCSQEYTDTCPKCGSKHLRYMGFGTQKVEHELNALFPEARILRMDADSTMTRMAFENGLSSFSNGDYDIMLGTQMVAKGLDFPKVTLVGVIGADQSMYSDDFRSFEKTFSLLTQVVGRSGRGNESGVAIIQTIAPDSPIIQLAASQNYNDFYEMEIMTRKLMLYPPFCDITLVCVQGINRQNTEDAAKYILSQLKSLVKNEYNEVKLIVLGPVIASVPKVNNKYRYKITIKSRNTFVYRRMLKSILIDYAKSAKYKDITAFVDINPESTI
ncbi:MAG: primosomal protein N', partial [Oscillospiraceae bacterium]|nr:primosomal protein N' [Oscillospiraceae bacterium]